MPKITKHGGVTEEPPVQIRRAMLGGEPKSVGSNSRTSPEKEQTTPDNETASLQPPVPTMANRSSKQKTEASSVHSTGGGTRETRPPRSGKQARAHTVTDEDDFEF